jgi:ATP-dependent Zn protease
MFGDEVSFASKKREEVSQAHNAKIDIEVQKILDESYKRVVKLLTAKDKELRLLSKNLFMHDYLDADEMDRIISGKGLDPNKTKKVRDWNKEEPEYLIKF